MTAGTQRDAVGLRSADRVLRVLELIGASPAGVTAAEVADHLGITLSTSYRLLATLERQDFIGHQSSEHRYILGRAVDALGRALQHQLLVTPQVRATMRTLMTDAAAPAYLTVFRGDDIAVAHIEESPEHPRISQLHVGFAEASHTTAFGKLMLATKDDAALEHYLDRHGLRALTPSSVTDAARLREQLDEVRSQQLAVEIDEYTAHLACIAAPVKVKGGVTVGAISVSVNTKDFSARSYELERTVRRGAWQVSAQLARG
jgi:DNA-binding IclR family transcriptional regulator